MVALKPGDCVECHLRNGWIIHPYSDDYDDTKTFEIIGYDSKGYYLFVPPYILIKGTIKLDLYFCNDNNIDRRYIGDESVYVREGIIYKVKSILDGCFCIKCKQFYNMAVPNQEDGTMICWKCENYPY